MVDLSTQPHRRFNPLTGEWILVSPHRTKRPWHGQVERVPEERIDPYDPGCYLCPGNGRAGGHRNPQYADTFVFANDFAALLPDTPAGESNQAGLFVAQAEPGVCRVICFSPRHDLTLSRMEVSAVRRVVDVWVDQFTDLAAQSFIKYVQIFENRGEMMGCSNPHPHCQIWATSSVPNEVAKESVSQQQYMELRGSILLGDYLALERKTGERIVFENEHFAVLVPFWAVWPFETMVVSARPVTGLDELTAPERDSLADALKRITTRYDNLFEVSFPYSMGFHQRPTDGEPHREWHLHMHFYPPLLRSATIRKFMVGYELLACPQRDITAESAAARLREMSERHYLLGAVDERR